MKNVHRIVRYTALVAILLAAISLSGCVTNPDTGTGQGTAGQGSDLPFPVLTPEATATPVEPQTIQPIVTPSPSATEGGQALPWGGDGSAWGFCYAYLYCIFYRHANAHHDTRADSHSICAEAGQPGGGCA